MFDVCSYNLNEKDDSVAIQIIDSNTLRVALCSSGNWFWGMNAVIRHADYAWMKMDVDDNGSVCTVRFKGKQPGDVFIYQVNGKWRELENF